LFDIFSSADLLHIHVVGGFPTYSFHYSSFGKIHDSISGAVAEVEQLVEQEQKELEEPTHKSLVACSA